MSDLMGNNGSLCGRERSKVKPPCSKTETYWCKVGKNQEMHRKALDETAPHSLTGLGELTFIHSGCFIAKEC